MWDKCTHCGKPVTEWVASRIGPEGLWHHVYCSEECFSHADEYSKQAWKNIYYGRTVHT